MLHACDNVERMSKMIQIRNVPDELHRELKARAARSGLTLTDYIQRELEQVVRRPPVDDVLQRVRSRPRPDLSISAADAVRQEREAR